MDFPIFGNKPGEAGGSSQAPLDAAPNVMEEPHSYAHDTLGGVAQQDVPSHQKLYVRYANTTEGMHGRCRLELLSVWASPFVFVYSSKPCLAL